MHILAVICAFRTTKNFTTYILGDNNNYFSQETKKNILGLNFICNC